MKKLLFLVPLILFACTPPKQGPPPPSSNPPPPEHDVNATLRPAVTHGASDFSVVGAASAHAATSDDNDATYAEHPGGGIKSLLLYFDASRFSSFRSATLRVRMARPAGATTVDAVALYHSYAGGLDGVSMVSTSQAITTTITTYSFAASNMPDSSDDIDDNNDLYLDLNDGTAGVRVYAVYLDIDGVLKDEGWSSSIPMGF